MVALIAAVVVAAAAAPADNSAPLREVIYKVSYTHHSTLAQGTYGGFDAKSDNNSAANGSAPVSQRSDISDEGTITVDVMAQANNALGIRLSESWRQHPRPQVFQGMVAPDGSVNFGGQPISEASASLLPFFGTQISAGQKTLDVGVKWSVNADSPAATVATTYEVKSIGDTGVTIQENTTIKVKGASGMDSSINGTIVYLAPKLVPLSGKIVRHSSRSGASDTTLDDMIVNFERQSDTLDK
jgi:hypothetical protein